MGKVGCIRVNPYFTGVGTWTGSGSFCGVKSEECPGTLYSYGPRWTSGALSKFPWGGGVGVCHSRVVACQGLSEVTFLPCLILTKRLIMNGIWDRANPTAAQRM